MMGTGRLRKGFRGTEVFDSGHEGQEQFLRIDRGHTHPREKSMAV